MQLHMDGGAVQFFSRRGIEHGASSSFDVLAPCVKGQIVQVKCDFLK